MADTHNLDELLPVLTGVLIEQVASGRPEEPGRPVTAHDVIALSLVSIAQSLATLADTVAYVDYPVKMGDAHSRGVAELRVSS